MAEVMVYTFGTSGVVPDDLQELLEFHDIRHIIDVRARPRSRKAWWNRKALEGRFGAAYIWAPCFGNPEHVKPQSWGSWCRGNYAGDPDALASCTARLIRHGYLGDVVLLCQEAEVAKCHRSAVAEFIGCKTVHLSEAELARREGEAPHADVPG